MNCGAIELPIELSSNPAIHCGIINPPIVNKRELITAIRTKKSFLCIGLDTDPEKIPVHLRDADDPVYEFNKAIIDATHDLCVAYKPNIAFYESMGAKGWESLEKQCDTFPVVFSPLPMPSVAISGILQRCTHEHFSIG